jgi:hypothetical protein
MPRWHICGKKKDATKRSEKAQEIHLVTVWTGSDGAVTAQRSQSNEESYD